MAPIGAGPHPLNVAAEYGCVEVLRELVENGGAKFQDAVTHDKATPAHFAADGGHSWTLRYLAGLSQPALVSARADGATPLHLAVARGHTDAVRVLVELGVDITAVDKQGRTPLAIAQNKGDAEIIDALKKSKHK
jgi:ankyrin repeat protein